MCVPQTNMYIPVVNPLLSHMVGVEVCVLVGIALVRIVDILTTPAETATNHGPLGLLWVCKSSQIFDRFALIRWRRLADDIGCNGQANQTLPEPRSVPPRNPPVTRQTWGWRNH